MACAAVPALEKSRESKPRAPISASAATRATALEPLGLLERRWDAFTREVWTKDDVDAFADVNQGLAKSGLAEHLGSGAGLGPVDLVAARRHRERGLEVSEVVELLPRLRVRIEGCRVKEVRHVEAVVGGRVALDRVAELVRVVAAVRSIGPEVRCGVADELEDFVGERDDPVVAVDDEDLDVR